MASMVLKYFELKFTDMPLFAKNAQVMYTNI